VGREVVGGDIYYDSSSVAWQAFSGEMVWQAPAWLCLA
jgi:hypothetical protein